MLSIRRWGGVWTLCLLAVVLAFLPALGFGFVNWDDDLHLYRNPLIVGHGPSPLADLLLTPGLGYPIPITILSYKIEHALFGLRPAAYHATNLILHLLCCALVYRIGRRLGLGLLGGAAALLLFGLHPVVAEPVCWITGRKDLLATLFALLSTYIFMAQPPTPARRVLAALPFYVLSLLSKPTAVLLPLFFLFCRERSSLPPPLHTSTEGELQAARPTITASAIWSLWPLAVCAVPIVLLGLRGQRAIGAMPAPRSAPQLIREVWYALGYHLNLLTFVKAPCAKHIPASMPPPFEPLVDLWPLLCGGLLALLLRWLPPARRRTAAIGLIFAAIAYAPSSNVLPLVRFLADSYLYLPLAGLAWCCGALTEHARDSLHRLLGDRPLGSLPTLMLAAIWCLPVAGLGWATWAAARPWHDGLTLWQHVVRRYPDSPEVCMNLGNAQFEAHQPEPALHQFIGCARRFGPDQFMRNIAVTLYQLGRRDRAREIFQQLAAVQPADPVVQKYLRLLVPPQDRR